MIGENETANILAGHYVDGLWSYPQILSMSKKNGVSKRALDAAIVRWRKALGEEALIQNDIRNGLEVPTCPILEKLLIWQWMHYTYTQT